MKVPLMLKGIKNVARDYYNFTIVGKLLKKKIPLQTNMRINRKAERYHILRTFGIIK